ncbi:MAG: NUDIX domain-containing protein [Candidatus Pacebacteria bacterium]|nr:NUDIX domain-containing protein [Candidatus Paceibacterota bacterium]
MKENYPKVGVGVMVIKEGKVLLGLRGTCQIGAGQYAWPGGLLEQGESIIECAKREVLEETGIIIKNVDFLCVINIKEYLPNHFLNIGMVAEWESGNADTLESHKTLSWNWYSMDTLPRPLFEGIQYYIEAYKNKRIFWDK